MRDSMTRRRAIIGTGALAAATTVGIATTTNQASATVTGEFTIPDGETVLTDTELQDVQDALNTLLTARDRSSGLSGGEDAHLLQAIVGCHKLLRLYEYGDGERSLKDILAQ